MHKNFRVLDEEGITLQLNKEASTIISDENSGKSAVIDVIRVAYLTMPYKRMFLQKGIFIWMKVEMLLILHMK